MSLDCKKYEPVVGESYMGIITIMLNGNIQRFKVVAFKEGNGFFFDPGSARMGKDQNGKDIYIKMFAFDSTYEREENEAVMKTFINNCIKSKEPSKNLNTQYSTPLVQHSTPRIEPTFQEDHNLPF